MPASLASQPSPSSSRRSKLRSPAHRVDRLSYTSSSNHNSTKGYSLLPVTIQYLDQLSLSMVAERPDLSNPKDVRYVLQIRNKPSSRQWRVSRTYRDYRDFQKRLLRVMQLGHFCNGECPWLYSFVKSHFPKEWRFYSYTSYVVRKRLDAFTSCIATLHAHLLKRENHSCSVIATAVAMELVAFITQDLPEDSEMRWTHFATSSSSLHTISSSSSNEAVASLPPLDISIRYTPGCGDASSTRSARSSRSSECSLCSPSRQSPKAPMSFEVGAPNSKAPDPEVTREEDDDGNDSELCASLTTLSCGHQFHDECIVPRLNERMQCPTCGHAQAFC